MYELKMVYLKSHYKLGVIVQQHIDEMAHYKDFSPTKPNFQG